MNLQRYDFYLNNLIYLEKSCNFAISAMRKFALHTLLYLLVVLIVYPLSMGLLSYTPFKAKAGYIPANYGHLHSRLHDVAHFHHIDLLFLGSSHCYRTFDTRLYQAAGYSAFNFGSSNQTPLQTLVLLKDYIDSLQPRRVFFEVHPDILANGGVESGLDLVSNAHFTPALAEMIATLRSFKVLNSAFASLAHGNSIPHADSVVSVYTTVNGEQVMADFRYVPGGFVQMPPYSYQPQSQFPHTIKINPLQVDALRRCIRLLGEKHIAVTLIEVPASRNLYHSYTNHREFEQQMSLLGSYINLNDSSALTSQLVDTIHYFDEDHLNQKGVEVVNSYIIECIL